MRWSSAFFAAAILLSATAPPTSDKRIAIYSTIANYTLPVVDRQDREYVGLLEILEPLGRVSARLNGQRWRLRYNETEGDFTGGKSKGRIKGRDIELGGPLIIENGRGLVPLASLGTILPKFLGGPVTLHERGRRLFIGGAGTHFTADLVRTTPARLVLNFTAPVNPTISTEPGRVRMVFTRDPLLSSGAAEQKFDDRSITSLTFSESNGGAELVVDGNVALMATFSAEGRTITVSAPPVSTTQGAGPGTQAQGTSPASTASSPSQSATPPSPIGAAGRRFSVAVDASHGGTERGAAITDQIAEKDVTLAFARQLRHELETRGLSVLMVRDTDATIPLDQRAETANSARVAFYIALHATSQGTGVRIYSALMPSAGENRGPFVDWDSAQASSISLSGAATGNISAELRKRNIPARGLAAPLRPLNNVYMTAVAVEIAPPPSGVADVNSALYQQTIAAAVADVIAAQNRNTGGSQ